MRRFEEYDRLFERIFQGMMPQGPAPIWCGYEMTVGPDGVPQTRQFGNANRHLSIDVIADEKNDSLKLVAEIPGVEKEDIEVTLDEDVVMIRATRGESSYQGSVPLHNAVDGDSVKATYKNGILEVSFKAEQRSTGQRVKVE